MNNLTNLVEIMLRQCPNDGIHTSIIPGVTLIRASAPTMPMPAIYEPTLCLIAQGRKRAMLGRTSFTYDPTSYLIASVGLPVMGSVIKASPKQPYLCLQMSLETSTLAELAIRYPAIGRDTGQPAIGLTLFRTTPTLLDAAIRLVSLLETPEDIDALAPLITREILYRLLIGESGATIRQMAQSNSRLNQIARSILWIRTHFRENCPIERAAEIANMSRSTFHTHFKAVTALSPLEFRTQLRMQEAQKLMVSEELDAASAGFSVGYGSPSQFSRDYVRIFGLPPARHALILRSVI